MSGKVICEHLLIFMLLFTVWIATCVSFQNVIFTDTYSDTDFYWDGWQTQNQGKLPYTAISQPTSYASAANKCYTANKAAIAFFAVGFVTAFVHLFFLIFRGCGPCITRQINRPVWCTTNSDKSLLVEIALATATLVFLMLAVAIFGLGCFLPWIQAKPSVVLTNVYIYWCVAMGLQAGVITLTVFVRRDPGAHTIDTSSMSRTPKTGGGVSSPRPQSTGPSGGTEFSSVAVSQPGGYSQPAYSQPAPAPAPRVPDAVAYKPYNPYGPSSKPQYSSPSGGGQY